MVSNGGGPVSSNFGIGGRATSSNFGIGGIGGAGSSSNFGTTLSWSRGLGMCSSEIKFFAGGKNISDNSSRNPFGLFFPHDFFVDEI
jgi:hypothetical protein